MVEGQGTLRVAVGRRISKADSLPCILQEEVDNTHQEGMVPSILQQEAGTRIQ